MPMTAIDMTVACLACGGKVVLTRDMVQAEPREPRPESKKPRREPRALEWMEELGITPLPRPSRDRIGELMIEAGVIDERQLREALSVQGGQGGKLAETLIQLRHIDRATFVEFLARQRGIRSIVIKNCEIEHDTLGLIPFEFALDREVCPIEKLGPLLTAGMACPLDSRTIEDTEEITGLKVMPYLCRADQIADLITRFHPGRELSVFDSGELPIRESGP